MCGVAENSVRIQLENDNWKRKFRVMFSCDIDYNVINLSIIQSVIDFLLFAVEYCLLMTFSGGGGAQFSRDGFFG